MGAVTEKGPLLPTSSTVNPPWLSLDRPNLLRCQAPTELEAQHPDSAVLKERGLLAPSFDGAKLGC